MNDEEEPSVLRTNFCQQGNLPVKEGSRWGSFLITARKQTTAARVPRSRATKQTFAPRTTKIPHVSSSKHHALIHSTVCFIKAQSCLYENGAHTHTPRSPLTDCRVWHTSVGGLGGVGDEAVYANWLEHREKKKTVFQKLHKESVSLQSKVNWRTRNETRLTRDQSLEVLKRSQSVWYLLFGGLTYALWQSLHGLSR